MSGAKSVDQRKEKYFAKVITLIEEYNKIFVVLADNVGSNHMQKIRQSLRGDAVVLMGKNTMMRKAIRDHLEKNPALESLLPQIRGNIGFVFTNGDLSNIRTKLLNNRVAAPAKAGIVAPNDVVVPKGNTGMEPTQTAFLQALNIPSKINKGQIEITADVPLIKAGQKVGNSEATLLAKLNIKPFSYGLSIKSVYDNGSVYDAAVLDLTDEDLLGKFRSAVSNVASISLEIGYPTIASLPHSIINGYKNVLAIALGTEYSFEEAELVKKILENPGAFAAAAPSAAGGVTTTTSAAAPVEEAPAEEEDADMGLGLFD
jgi:large subunit ribosomal protein LP0